MSFDVFEMLLGAMMAAGQVMVMLVGLVFALIGGAMIYDHRLWLRKAKRVNATIVGVRVGKGSKDNTDIYYPVVEYLDDRGEPIRAECDSGSSSYINKKPGDRQVIYIMPDNPELFRMRGNLFLFMGIFFGLMGLGAAAASVILFEATKYTPFVAVLFLAWGLIKLAKNIKPRSAWKGFATRAAVQERRSGLADKREALEFLDADAMRGRQKALDEQYQKWSWVGLLIALCLIGGGIWFGQDMQRRLEVGVYVDGEVVAMDAVSDSDGTTYYPVVAFEEMSGRAHRFKDRVGSSPPSYRVGDDVTVIYMPDDASDAMIDRGLWNWTISAGFLGIGGLLLLGMVAQGRSVRRRLMRK